MPPNEFFDFRLAIADCKFRSWTTPPIRVQNVGANRLSDVDFKPTSGMNAREPAHVL